MPNLSLTDLVDVISLSGTPKATKVGQIKNRQPYHPATDFYKPLRDGILDVHRSGKSKKALASILSSITDGKKLTNYPPAIDGYRKWWGKKSITWFEPPRGTYGHAGVSVAINPELGLDIGGARYVLKLYFKADSMSKLRVDLITVLMEVVLSSKMQPGDTVALLDVRRAKLFPLAVPVKPAKAVVDAELAYISALWPHV